MKASILFVSLLLLFACKKDDDLNFPEFPEGTLAGGATTIFSQGADAFTLPLANLEGENINQHFLADANFGAQFVTAPAIVQGGLGPIFNQNSCESCHLRNGRSSAPKSSGDPATGLLLRLSLPGESPNGGPIPVPGFGPQLQTKAIFGETSEGRLDIEWAKEVVKFLDGQTVELQQPIFSVGEPYQPLPQGILTSPRSAPPVFGLGLLEAIEETDILAHADENDLDGDGISGRPNMGWDIVTQSPKLGRFGWKAANPTAIQQTADAFNHDMGITNSYFPQENCAGQSNCQSGLNAGHDIDDEFLQLTTFYFQTLAVPAARNQSNPTVISGKQLFQKAKCGGCHIPKFETGSHPIDELSHQIIFPYTDLLLHDMGEALADHRPDFLANGKEWRTPPLWGIGLAQVVNGNATFLHDGRARTLEEAILWHGGEAANAKDYYLKLNKEERNALIQFVESL
jgi:CxxC motif-containing protein (DUF1111 family)